LQAMWQSANASSLLRSTLFPLDRFPSLELSQYSLCRLIEMALMGTLNATRSDACRAGFWGRLCFNLLARALRHAALLHAVTNGARGIVHQRGENRRSKPSIPRWNFLE